MLALKSRGDVTRSPKQGYQWPHEKDLCPPKIFLKKNVHLEKINQWSKHKNEAANILAVGLLIDVANNIYVDFRDPTAKGVGRR